jgi:hypothetical protein
MVWVGFYFEWIKTDVRAFQRLPTVTGYGYAGTGPKLFWQDIEWGFRGAEIDLALRERRERRNISLLVL